MLNKLLSAPTSSPIDALSINSDMISIHCKRSSPPPVTSVMTTSRKTSLTPPPLVTSSACLPPVYLENDSKIGKQSDVVLPKKLTRHFISDILKEGEETSSVNDAETQDEKMTPILEGKHNKKMRDQSPSSNRREYPLSSSSLDPEGRTTAMDDEKEEENDNNNLVIQNEKEITEGNCGKSTSACIATSMSSLPSTQNLSASSCLSSNNFASSSSFLQQSHFRTDSPDSSSNGE